MKKNTLAGIAVLVAAPIALAGCTSALQRQEPAQSPAADGTLEEFRATPTPTPTPTYVAPEPDPVTMIRTAVTVCKMTNKNGIADGMKYVKVYDGGHTAVIDTRSQYADIAGVACLLYGIDTPRSIIARIDSTTSLQGSQTARANGFTYRWSYHPDNGLNMVIEER